MIFVIQECRGFYFRPYNMRVDVHAHEGRTHAPLCSHVHVSVLLYVCYILSHFVVINVPCPPFGDQK